jgi:hypothetical protein|tara:strand:- start:987 stop:2342 length:1356 start_codon:yes stop_codon:yes gene_type:complete
MIFKTLEFIPNDVLTKDYVSTIATKTKADPAFQANILSRWKTEQKSAFITSCLTGMAPSRFILADVDLCLQYAIDNDNMHDVEYFQYWKDKKIKYLNIDSNNRTLILQSFYEDKIEIEYGKYLYFGQIYTITKHNSVYSILPKIMKEAIDNAFISIACYVNASREELSDLFDRVNDGEGLNNPERRNCRTSTIARKVRDLASKYYDFFYNDSTKWFSPKQANRRYIDDFVAKLALWYFEGEDKHQNKTNLHNMYLVENNASLMASSFVKHFNSFMNLFDKDLYAIANKNAMHDLFVIFTQMKKEKKILNTDKKPEFIKAYVKAIASCLSDNTLYDVGTGDPRPFSTMLDGLRPENNKKRIIMIRNHIKLDKYFIQLDPKRVISDDEKLVVAARDNFKTPEGKNIDLSKLQTKKYHKGHIEPHRQGAETSVKNSVIQRDKDNWKLGKKAVNV